MKQTIVAIFLIIINYTVFAQSQKRDTTIQPRTVVVTSAFKPSLITTSKVNFSAASPLPDSVRPVLQYDVPAQNLSFVYQSPALKPLAANIDSAIHWNNINYIKAGYGNYTTPYLQAGLSFGDGVTSAANIHAKYTSSKGPIEFQNFSKINVEAIGIMNSVNNENEWSGNLYYDNNTQYQYGFRPDSLKFSKDDLRQSFTTLGGKIALRNKTQNRFGLSYNPNASLNLFNDSKSGKESNFIINAPLSKSIAKIFAFNVTLTADITSYRSSKANIDNNLYYLTPNVEFKTPNFRLAAGFTPSWDNSIFALLPNFTAEAKLNEEKFILQAGWIGYYHKTTYQYLASVNPWLQQPTSLLNTRIKEQYAGFKGSAGSHLTYNAKVSYLVLNDQPLFVNDTVTGKSFDVVNEPELKDIRLHGEIGYTQSETFSFLAGATFNQYSSMDKNAEPWGLLPLEITGSLRYKILKDLMLKSDLFFWDGARYRSKSFNDGKLPAAFDLNAGVELALKPQLNLWLQFNNIFNNKYHRWNQYKVLGFNVLAGVVYSFDKINK